MFLLHIKKATIIRGFGADKVSLETDLPAGCWPYTGTQSVSFECAAGTAEEYLKANFEDVPFEVIVA